MSEARFLIGDVFERMAELPDGSIDLILTSPPFLALRSYLPADHPDKGKEIGSEPTPAAFLDTLLALTAEWRRLLAPHGSLCVELGDTYSGSGGAGGDYADDGLRAGQSKFDGSMKHQRISAGGMQHPIRPNGMSNGNERKGDGWPLAKSLCGIPHLYHLSLAYGRNLLTGEPSPAGQWRIRNVVAWVRPNPPVGALGDKFRPATSYMTVACVSDRRYFDLDAVRGETKDPDKVGGSARRQTYPRPNGGHGDGDPMFDDRVRLSNPAGAPPLDWWEIPTQPYSGSHYATWPMALCERPIKAMCPSRVCRVCGKPSERIVGQAEYHQSPNAHGSGRAPDDVAPRTWESGIVKGKNQSADLRDGGVVRVAPTLGWSDCGHDDWRNGHVLDPFGGSGTTAAVATGHGRDCTLIDLDPRNADLARDRVGMFLSVEEPA